MIRKKCGIIHLVEKCYFRFRRIPKNEKVEW